MTGTLRDTLHHLAVDFAAGVLGVIRGASLEDILAETEGGPGRRGPGRPPSQAGERRVSPERAPRAGRKGRLPRRSASDIGELVDRIVQLLSTKPKGLRAEQIRAALGIAAKELPRPLAQALASKRISKTGQKRATTYSTGAAASAPTAKKTRGGRSKTSGRKGGRRRAAKRAPRTSKEGSPKPSGTADGAGSGATEGT